MDKKCYIHIIYKDDRTVFYFKRHINEFIVIVPKYKFCILKIFNFNKNMMVNSHQINF